MSILGPSSLSQRDVQIGAPRGARFGPPGGDDEVIARAGQVKTAVLAMRGKLTDANAKNERLESEVLSKTQQVEQLNAMRATLEEQREALEDEMRVTQRKLAKAERDLQVRDEVIRTGIEGDSRNELEKRMLRDKLAQEKMLTQESLKRVRALETELENARGFLDVSEDMQVHFVDRIVELEGAIEKLKYFEALATELNREKAVLETDMRYKQNEIDKLQNEVRPELQARLRAAEEALRTLQSENDDLRLRAQAAVAQQEQARLIAMQKESEAKQDRYMQQMKDWSQDMILENVVPDDAASRTQQAAVDKALRFVYSSRPILEKVMIPSDIGHDIFTEHVWKQLADRLGVANATRNDDEACMVDPVELECVDNPAYRMNSMVYNKNTLDGIRKTTKKDPMTRETVSDSDWAVLNDSVSLTSIREKQAVSSFEPEARPGGAMSEQHEISVKATLQGHTNLVKSVTFSPDGRTIATGSRDTTVKLWDASTGDLKATIQTADGESLGVYSVAFSPDGRTIATGSWDNTAKLWDVSTGTLKKKFEGHTNLVFSVMFSPDGRTIATGSLDQTAKLWDTETAALKKTINGHTGGVTSVYFSPDGHTLATGSWDGTAKLWDASTGALKVTLQGHTSKVKSVAFSPDGRTIATGSEDNTTKLWDASTGALNKTINQDENVYSVAFSPDGLSIATGTSGNSAKIHVAETGALMKIIKRSHGVFQVGLCLSVAFSPDGRTFATGWSERIAILWNI
jgi:WD40 repeat protein